MSLLMSSSAHKLRNLRSLNVPKLGFPTEVEEMSLRLKSWVFAKLCCQR